MPSHYNYFLRLWRHGKSCTSGRPSCNTSFAKVSSLCGKWQKTFCWPVFCFLFILIFFHRPPLRTPLCRAHCFPAGKEHSVLWSSATASKCILFLPSHGYSPSLTRFLADGTPPKIWCTRWKVLLRRRIKMRQRYAYSFYYGSPSILRLIQGYLVVWFPQRHCNPISNSTRPINDRWSHSRGLTEFQN